MRIAGIIGVTAILAAPATAAEVQQELDAISVTATLGNRGTLMALGAATSLLPCPPLLGLLALAADAGSMTAGAACGASFGLGLVCSPLVVAGGGLGLIARHLRLEVCGMQTILQLFACLMLITMGLRLLLGV